MSITKEQFLDNFDELMRLNASIPENVISRLTVRNINGRHMGPDDLVAIVEGIKQGNRDKIERRRDLVTYLERTLIFIEDNRLDRRNWASIYGFQDDGVDVYEIDEKMEEKIHELLEVLYKNPQEFAEFFALMKPSEEMGLISLERQGIQKGNNQRINLPPELYREEIRPFVGIKVKGGRTKTRRRYKMKKMKTIIRRKGKKSIKNKRVR